MLDALAMVCLLCLKLCRYNWCKPKTGLFSTINWTCKVSHIAMSYVRTCMCLCIKYYSWAVRGCGRHSVYSRVSIAIEGEKSKFGGKIYICI